MLFYFDHTGFVSLGLDIFKELPGPTASRDSYNMSGIGVRNLFTNPTKTMLMEESAEGERCEFI